MKSEIDGGNESQDVTGKKEAAEKEDESEKKFSVKGYKRESKKQVWRENKRESFDPAGHMEDGKWSALWGTGWR